MRKKYDKGRIKFGMIVYYIKFLLIDNNYLFGIDYRFDLMFLVVIYLNKKGYYFYIFIFRILGKRYCVGNLVFVFKR